MRILFQMIEFLDLCEGLVFDDIIDFTEGFGDLVGVLNCAATDFKETPFNFEIECWIAGALDIRHHRQMPVPLQVPLDNPVDRGHRHDLLGFLLLLALELVDARLQL